MKTISQDYINKEEAVERKPAELYHIWRDGGAHWYYTSGDAAVVYDSATYLPGSIERGSVSYNSNLDVTTLTITVAALTDAIINFLVQNPVEILWVSVSKIHRDQSPLETDILFIGQIKSVDFQGIKGNINCVGFEYFLRMTVPSWRYQLTCNHSVFDSKCGLTKATYALSTSVELSADKLTLTSIDFGLKEDGYYIGGEVVYMDESRAISSHSGTSITIAYKFIELTTGSTISAYPGCDGRATTCRDKYSNIDNFLGFPFIPLENPATRVSW